LAAMVDHPDARVAELDMLSERERARVLEEWNATERPFRSERFTDILSQVARRHAEKTAVRFLDRALTYAQLEARTDDLAGMLCASGVRHETPVAIFSDRTIDYLCALIAILKAGGIYIPLDPHQPARRSGHILAQTREAVILYSKPCAAQLEEGAAQAGHDFQRHCLDRPLTGGAVARPPVNGALPADLSLAYIIYTSGSTGQPKGAMVHHGGMVNHLYCKIGDLGLTESDIVAQNAPQSFDISVWQFLSALLMGGCTHIVDSETSRDPPNCWRLSRENGSRYWKSCPACWSPSWTNSCRWRRHVRTWLICGG